MVHCPSRKHRGDCKTLRRELAIGKDDDVVASSNCLLGSFTEGVKGHPHSRDSVLDGIGHIEGHGPESALSELADAPDLVQFLVG